MHDLSQLKLVTFLCIFSDTLLYSLTNSIVGCVFLITTLGRVLLESNLLFSYIIDSTILANNFWNQC